MKVLLHACCGPCASACVPRLKEAGREVAVFFANSNIDCEEEFERRKREAEKVAAAEGAAFMAAPYDHGAWLDAVAGLEGEKEGGARCAKCFEFNLREAARAADAAGCGGFCTSLTVSPHKHSPTVFAAGDRAAANAGGVPFLHEDFKKRGGFALSVRRSAELGLYRQNYCGCEFSRKERNNG